MQSEEREALEVTLGKLSFNLTYTTGNVHSWEKPETSLIFNNIPYFSRQSILSQDGILCNYEK